MLLVSPSPVSVVLPPAVPAPPMAVPPAERYLQILGTARDLSDRAVERTDRLVDDAQHSLVGLGQDRLTGAAEQADAALGWLATAERYHERVGDADIPQGSVHFAQQAARDLEMGTRALRRASALVTDPDVDSDPQLRQSAQSSLALAQSHYRMAQWELKSAATATEPDGPDELGSVAG